MPHIDQYRIQYECLMLREYLTSGITLNNVHYKCVFQAASSPRTETHIDALPMEILCHIKDFLELYEQLKTSNKYTTSIEYIVQYQCEYFQFCFLNLENLSKESALVGSTKLNLNSLPRAARVPVPSTGRNRYRVGAGSITAGRRMQKDVK